MKCLNLILGFWWIPWWRWGDKENDLLHDINIYRKVQNLPILEENYDASCLAIKFAYDLKDKHCEDFHDFHPLPSRNPSIPNFQKSVWKCNITINTTKDWVLMRVCVPGLDEDDLFSNYTRDSHFTEYLNNSKYTTAGVGFGGDWNVLIVSTNTTFLDNNTTFVDISSASYLLDGWLLMMATFWSVFVFLFN